MKNYWNTYICKKISCRGKEEKNAKTKTNEIAKPHLVIKPQPRTFSSITAPCLKMGFTSEHQSGAKAKHFPIPSCSAASTSGLNHDKCIDKWWGNVMDDKGDNPENGSKGWLGVQDGMLMKDFIGDEDLTGCLIEDQSWSNFLDDINLWDL